MTHKNIYASCPSSPVSYLKKLHAESFPLVITTHSEQEVHLEDNSKGQPYATIHTHVCASRVLCVRPVVP